MSKKNRINRYKINKENLDLKISVVEEIRDGSGIRRKEFQCTVGEFERDTIRIPQYWKDERSDNFWERYYNSVY